jgi:hypothetical protein
MDKSDESIEIGQNSTPKNQIPKQETYYLALIKSL